MVDKLTGKTTPQTTTAPIDFKNTKITTQKTNTTEGKQDSFQSSSIIKNVKILLPQDLTTYSKTITFEIEKDKRPKIVYSGAKDKDVHDKISTNGLPNFDTDAISLKKLPNPNPTSKNDFYTLSVKAGWNVNFDIDGTVISYDEPITPGTPSLNVNPKDLKISPSTEPGYSKVITFTTDEKEIPYITSSGRKSDETFANKVVDLSLNAQFNDNSLVISKVKNSGKNEYTIKVKDGWLASFQFGKVSVNYDAPFTPAQTQLPKLSSDDVLSYDASGKHKYPKSHSVFTNNIQDDLSASDHIPFDWKQEDFKKHIEGYKNDYTKIPYGSLHLKNMAQEIASNKGKITIEEALIKANKEYTQCSRKHKPIYRLGNETKPTDNSRDFEVLFFTANNSEGKFNFDAEVVEHSVINSYGSRCKAFQIVRSPKDKKELLDAIKERAASAKKNNRKLYLMYRGHGDTDGYQADLDDKNKTKQGSKSYIFSFDNFRLTEEEYKKACEDLEGVETIHYINSCHPGAAVTATEHEKQKEIFKCVA